MYQNGQKLNRHSRVKRHKRVVKERYARKAYFCSWNEMMLRYKDMEPTKWGHPLEYWHDWSHPISTRFFKREATRKTRRAAKQDLKQECEQSLPLDRATDRRIYDLDWALS